MRWVGRAFALVGVLFAAAALAVGGAAYLTATGRSLHAIKAMAPRVAALLEGQRTERLQLEVQVRPEARTLAARAALTMRVTADGRRRFFFLLDDGLRLRSVRGEDGGELAAYRLWMIVAVDIGRALAAGETATLTFEYEGTPGGGLVGVSQSILDGRDVLLGSDAFWYPADLQGQFTADVAVTVPANLTVVHAGEEQERAQFGRLQRVRWTTERPVPGLSLVAGPYRATDLRRAQTQYRVYLAEDVDLDAQRLLDSMAESDALLTERYGRAGYGTLAMYVTRRLRRGFNDGAGVIGLSIRYFRRGDYGAEIVAHEVAHNWWGATVMEQWLRPGTGGEWIVEGFAEFSSLLVTEAAFGEEAWVRRLARESFDPRRPRAVADMSVIDNAFAEAASRDIIYQKGAYVAAMLRHMLGDERFFNGLRTFLERFRFRAATDRDLEATLAEVTGAEVADFFNEWVRSGRILDLQLDAGDAPGKVALRNQGGNPVVGDVELWVFARASSAPERHTLRVGEQLLVGADFDHAIADPRLTWADMDRSDNRVPPTRFPLAAAVSTSGVRAVIESETFPWSAATLRLIRPNGAEFASWELDSTVRSSPQWLDDDHLVLSMSEPDRPVPAVVLFDARDGRRRILGYGETPAVVAGTVFAARGDRVQRWSGPRWQEETAWRVRGRDVERATPSPDGGQVAYAVTRGNDLELIVRDVRTGWERSLLVWDRDLRGLAWAADGSRVYVALGGEWDWQVWDVPVDGSPLSVVIEGAAAIGDIAVAPDGRHLAVAAAPSLDYPRNPREVVVLGLASKAVQRFTVPEADAERLVWADGETLLAVVAPSGGATPWHLPLGRSLVQIRPADGTIDRVAGAALSPPPDRGEPAAAAAGD